MKMISYKTKFFVYDPGGAKAHQNLEAEINNYIEEELKSGWTLYTLKVLNTLAVVILRKEN